MVEYRPMRIPGRWRDGFVLDYHTVESEYLGDDEYGHPVFNTTRTQIGELLYRLKYQSDRAVIDDIASSAAEFIRRTGWGADVLVPVPPSRVSRPVQPVLVLAREIGNRLAITVQDDCVKRIKDAAELKNVYDYDERLRLLEGAYAVAPGCVAARTVLLFDDLFRSGATMNSITALLYDRGQAKDVFALAITRTRRRL